MSASEVRDARPWCTRSRWPILHGTPGCGPSSEDLSSCDRPTTRQASARCPLERSSSRILRRDAKSTVGLARGVAVRRSRRVLEALPLPFS